VPPFVEFLVLIKFQTILKLAERFIGRFDAFHAVPAKIMGGVLHVLLGPPQRTNRFTDFGVGFRQSRRRGCRLGSGSRNCGGSGRFG
jgi:hypothetical protein